MRHLRFILIALFATTSSPLAAQEVPVEPGARVRVKAPPQQPDWVDGTVVGWESESLVLQPEEPGTPLTLARDQITELDVYDGRKGHALLGAGIGFGVGVGWTVALLSNESICNPEETCDAGDWAKGIAIFGGAGAGLGALVGLLIKTDRWEAVPLERIRLSLTPVRDGRLAIMASVRLP